MTDAETNRKIAEAMGWKHVDEYEFAIPDHSPDRRIGGIPPDATRAKPVLLPDYLHDANAALEAAIELLPVDWQLEYDILNELWFARLGSYEETDHMEHHVWNAPAFTGALCAMILAYLAEREAVKR